MRGRSMNDPRIVVARLSGISRRHAAKMTPDAEAVAELRQVAAGRADLLAEVAGTNLAAAEKSLHPAWEQRAAELCILAGADEALIPGWVETVRARLAVPLYQSHD